MFRYYIFISTGSKAPSPRRYVHLLLSLHLEQSCDPAEEIGAATHYVECFELESGIEAFSYHFIAAWDDRAHMVLVSWVNAVAARSPNGRFGVL